MYFATAPVTITMNLDGEAYPATVTKTWPAAGSLFVPAKIALKMPPNKFKRVPGRSIVGAVLPLRLRWYGSEHGSGQETFCV